MYYLIWALERSPGSASPLSPEKPALPKLFWRQAKIGCQQLPRKDSHKPASSGAQTQHPPPTTSFPDWDRLCRNTLCRTTENQIAWPRASLGILVLIWEQELKCGADTGSCSSFCCVSPPQYKAGGKYCRFRYHHKKMMCCPRARLMKKLDSPETGTV